MIPKGDRKRIGCGMPTKSVLGCFLASVGRHRLFALGLQVFKFLLVGLPSFAVAVPFNAFLVEHCAWSKWLAYALTQYLQMTVNFFICRHFVFTPSRTKSIARQYLQFTGVIAAFRVADWGVYTLVVSTTGIHYLVVQCANVLLFSLAKFAFSKSAIEGPATPAPSVSRSHP